MYVCVWEIERGGGRGKYADEIYIYTRTRPYICMYVCPLLSTLRMDPRILNGELLSSWPFNEIPALDLVSRKYLFHLRNSFLIFVFFYLGFQYFQVFLIFFYSVRSDTFFFDLAILSLS